MADDSPKPSVPAAPPSPPELQEKAAVAGQDDVHEPQATAAVHQKPRDELGQFLLDASASSAFGEIVAAHNGLLQRLASAQEHLDAMQQEQQTASKNLQALLARQEQNESQTQQGLESAKRESSESCEAVKKLVAEQTASLEERSQKAVADIDASLTPKLTSLERAVEDIAAASAEITSKTLPRWRQDLGTEVQKLASQLEAEREKSRQQGMEQQARTAEQAARINEVRVLLEQQLSEQSKSWRQDLTPLTSQSETLRSDLKVLEHRLISGNGSIEERLQVLEQRVETLDQRAVAAEGSAKTMGDSLAKLESAVKQAEFERLSSAERAQRELDDRLSQEHSSQQAAVEKLRQELSTQLSAETKKLGARLDTVSQEASAALKAAQTQLSSDLQAVQAKLEEERKTCGGRLQELEKSGASESGRLGKLEGRLEEHQRESSKHTDESLQQLRKEVEAQAQEVALKIEASDCACRTRGETLQEAVDLLTKELQSFVKQHTERETGTAHLEETVRALELRVRPWRTPSRSTSPPVRTAAGEETPDTAGSSMQRGLNATASSSQSTSTWHSPKPPMRRPASAGHRRGGGPQRDMTSAGPGFAAARARAVGKA